MTDGAFAHAAHDTARCFRTILDAIARPGRIFPFAPPLTAPPGFSDAAAAIALSLCDFQTTVWLGAPLRTPEITRYLRFHTGAPMAEDAADADFVFADADDGLPDLGRLKRGRHEYPDRSVSLVLVVETLDDAGPLRLSGPGIERPRRFGAPPLGESFWASLAKSHADYPLGIDVFLIDGQSIAAIPRSTRIEISGAF